MELVFSRSPHALVVGTLGVVANPGLTSVYAIGRTHKMYFSLLVVFWSLPYLFHGSFRTFSGVRLPCLPAVK